jgi:hypothetical protein
LVLTEGTESEEEAAKKPVCHTSATSGAFVRIVHQLLLLCGFSLSRGGREIVVRILRQAFISSRMNGVVEELTRITC